MDIVDREQRIQTVCLFTLTAVAIGAALYFLRPVLIPFVLAVFLVFCLTPVIDFQMHYLRLKRPLAVISTVMLGCVVLFLLWLLIWTSVSQMTANASVYESQLHEMIEKVADGLPLARAGIDREELPSFLELPQGARNLLSRVISSIMTLMSNGLLVVIFMVFLMAGKTVDASPGSLREEIESHIKRYILTKVLISAFTGTMVGVVLSILRVELAMVFGLLAFLLNFIPNIGSIVATLLPLPVIVLSPELSTTAKVLALAIPGVIQFAVGNLIEPKIMGESLDLHPVVVLLGLIFFGMIWGIIGMILATPIVAVTKIVLERIEETAPVGRLLGGRLDGSATANENTSLS